VSGQTMQWEVPTGSKQNVEFQILTDSGESVK